MQTYPSVAIVILNYNTRTQLETFLPFVMASTYEGVRVVLADNASTDDSVGWVRSHYPDVEIIVNLENFGFAGGYNEALKQVNAKYYVLLNSDVEVTPGWLTPVIALMEQDERVAACQPKLLSYTNRHLFEYAGAAGGWIDCLGYPFSRGRVFDVCEVDEGQYNAVQPIFWASGAAMFVRAEVFHKMGGFDPYFFAHQEEIDLCWRMQLAGFTIMSVPSSVVYHVGGGTLPKGQRKVYLNFRNNLVMLYKNLPGRELLWKLPFRIMLDVVSGVQAMMSGNKGFMSAVLRAHWSFYKWLPSGKHQNIFPSVRSGKVQGYYKGSVVWSYFIGKKKTFREIVE